MNSRILWFIVASIIVGLVYLPLYAFLNLSSFLPKRGPHLLWDMIPLLIVQLLLTFLLFKNKRIISYFGSGAIIAVFSMFIYLVVHTFLVMLDF